MMARVSSNDDLAGQSAQLLTRAPRRHQKHGHGFLYLLGPGCHNQLWSEGRQFPKWTLRRQRRLLHCTAVNSAGKVALLPTQQHGIARTALETQVPTLLHRPECLACIWIPASETETLIRSWTRTTERVQFPSNKSMAALKVPLDEPSQQRAALRDLLLSMKIPDDAVESFYAPLMTMIGIFGASLKVPATQEWSSTIRKHRYADLRLSYLNSTPCPRFHTDSVPLRMLCTLEGPGTEIARETYVWRERFETARQVGSTFRISKPWWWRWQRYPKTLATCTAAEHAQQVVFRPGVASAATITTPRCDRASTPDGWAIHDPLPDAPIERLLPWHAAFLKGTEWTQAHASTKAVIHRSPTMASNERRWLFQIDLHVSEQPS